MERLKMADTDYGQLARVLRKVDFFAPMTVGQLEMILPFILLYRFGAGEDICDQGDDGDAFYILRDGKVSVWVKKGFFRFAKKVAELGPGQFFGEMALVTREKRSATVNCEEASTVYVLTAADFDYVLKRNPSFAAEIELIAKRRKFLSQQGE